MKRFSKTLMQIFGVLYADGGAAPTEPAVSEPTGDKSATTETKNTDLSNYIGSEKVNPERRPLKAFDRSGFGSTDEIDTLIQSMGEKIFLKGPEKKQNVKKETSKNANNSEGPLEDADRPAAEDAEKTAFYAHYGISDKDFSSLPENIQERLATAYEKYTGRDTEYNGLNDKYNQILSQVDVLEKDPLIAARLEELSTDQKYVADSIPAFDEATVQTLLDNHGDSMSKFVTALNEAVQNAAHKVLSIERGVVERKAADDKVKKEATDVISKILSLDERLAIKERNLNRFVELGSRHPEYEKLYGKGSLMEMIASKRYSPSQIVAKGAEEILTEYAKTKGWDKERDRAIAQGGVKKLIDKLRQQTSTANIMVPAVPRGNKEVDTGTYDRKSLIEEVASGKTSRCMQLLKAADRRGDAKQVNELTNIFEIGMCNKK